MPRRDYCANVIVTNTGTAATSSWTVRLDPHQSRINNLWNGSWSASGSTIVVSSLSWNGAIAPGASTSFGFCADKSGTQYMASVLSATSP
jgi:cellulase/cellobiase CelA1